MIKVLNISQIREADKVTILKENISSYELMERASRLCFEEIKKIFLDKATSFTVFAGCGNNGGDGLAIARMLHEAGYSVKVVFINFGKISNDCEINLKKLPKNINVDFLDDDNFNFEINDNSVIIDSILGSGISRKPEGLVLKVINQINNLKNFVISIDLPSGLLADESSEAHSNSIVKANFTITIGLPKLALFMPENSLYFGNWILVQIGLDQDFIDNSETNYFFLQKQDVSNLIKIRPKFAHKGNFGHALIASGSKGFMGAAILAARACLKSGCGLLTVHCPKNYSNIIQTAVPAAMCSIDDAEEVISSIPNIDKYSAISFGPGCSQDDKTVMALKLLIQNSSKPLILDADGLNILANNKTWLAFLPKNTILTPHVGEFERLFGKSKNGFERLQTAIEMSSKYNCIIVLKGAYSAIVLPDKKVFFNSTGNPGLAKGGSGDILTGLMTGLLAQGYLPYYAAILAVFIHGLAGDIAAEEHTEEAMNADDVIKNISNSWKNILFC